jgi:hypothetical protein
MSIKLGNKGKENYNNKNLGTQNIPFTLYIVH